MFHAPIRSPNHVGFGIALRSTVAVIAAMLAILAATGSADAQKITSAPEVAVDELMKPGDLPDIVVGSPDAKVTVVEYSSLTCPHCANFQAKVFPEFKTKYIDTGKVRFITREFPLDNLAAAGAMLARCVEPSKSFDFVELMFAKQEEWARGPNPKAKLFEIAKQAGFSEESFEKCLTDQALLDKVNAVRTRASDKFQIASTPTFFINGKRLVGNRPEDFDKVIEPMLASK